MQITHVKIEDFGPHKKIDVDTSSNIVGLLGPNGSGKSNLLEAIKLGLSSTSADNIDSYVRDGAETAIIDIDFKKGGASGKIYRKIGKSPKRFLEWDGQKYTKAEEIERILKDILGADKHVLSNAVFVAQGELDKLLFGVQAEREELFIKMMLLNYMAQVADAADTRANKLAATVRDFTVLIDELRSQVATAERDRADVELQIAASPDRSEEVHFMDSIVSLHLSADEALASSRKNLQESKELGALLSEGISKLMIPSVRTIEDLDNYINSRQSDLKSLNSRLEELNQCRLAQEEIAGLVSTVMSLRASITATTGGLPIEEPTKALAEAQQSVVDDIKYAQKLLKEIDKAENDMRESARKITEAEVTQEMLDKLKALQDEMDDIDKKHYMLKLKSDTLSVAITALKSGKECKTCPLCDATMLFSVNELIDKKTQVMTELNYLSLRVLNLTQDKESIESKIDSMNSTVTYHKAMIDSNIQRIAERREGLKELREGDLEVEQRTLDAINAHYTAKKTVYDQVAALRKELSSATKKLESVPVERKQQASSYSESERKEVYDKVAQLEGHLKSLNNEYKRLFGINTDRSLRSATAEKYAAKREGYLTQVRESVWPPFCTEIMSRYSDLTYESALGVSTEDMRSYHEKHISLKGRLDQINKTAADALRRFSDLEKQAESETIKRSVIAGLKRMKVAFSRQGIPNAYINYKYKQLIENAQVHLSEMEANFTVRPHPDKPVSFQFMRTDNSSGTYFEQNKLSGGQRVRLTIAVLIAIQRQLVPDLGLLVLDEPSMHVEESGICALRDLFMTMGSRMANNESQIWISDHNDILSTAFGKIIHL
jgi:exonuclease SbcC